MLFPYLGVGGGFGGWSNYYVDGYASGTHWHISSDDEKPWNLYLRPSIVLKSPALNFKDAYFGIYAEPGVMLNIPYHSVYVEKTDKWSVTEYKKISTTKGQWCAMDLRVGVYVNVGQCGISVGYMMSDFDSYSQRRHLSYDGISFSKFYPKKHCMQGAYITLSYYFQ